MEYVRVDYFLLNYLLFMNYLFWRITYCIYVCITGLNDNGLWHLVNTTCREDTEEVDSVIQGRVIVSDCVICTGLKVVMETLQ